MATIDDLIPLFRPVAVEVGELRKEVHPIGEKVDRLEEKVDRLDERVIHLEGKVDRLEETTSKGFRKFNSGLRLMRDEMFDIKVEHRHQEKRIDELEEKQAA
jgi:predicted RNase H-like nuclease (RuvC/YqgF family)